LIPLSCEHQKLVPWLAVMIALLPISSDLRAQSNITLQYFYDDLGQLVKVIDSSGNEIDYSYDAVGNILQITRGTAPAAGSLAILNFTPQRGAVGQTVTIQGQGFSPTPGANIVQFSGTQATVTSASASTLVVTVPSGAATGPISVTVGATTVTTAGNFTVVPIPVVTSLSRKSALFNTVVPNLAVTGANLTGAMFSFPTAAIAITSTSINSSGTSATLSIRTGTVAGTFALVATTAFGSSDLTPTPNNRFTVVDPKSTAISASGVPDVVEASFGLDPLDPNSVPNTSFPPSGEVDPLIFSVLNAAGTAPGQPASMEADALVFSVLNIAGMTGGQPMKSEADALVFSVLNAAGTAPGQPASMEADALVFSALNIAGMTGGQPVQMEADGLVFSVLNAAGSGGTGQVVKVEADALPASVLNLAGVSGNQPMQMEADGIPFSVNNTATGAPAAAKPAASPEAGNPPSIDTSPRKTNAVRNGAPQANTKASDLNKTNSSKSADSQDSDKTRREP
jgi:YD repeat-containing protein